MNDPLAPLRIEIPGDAAPDELADVCLALLSEPGVADIANRGSQRVLPDAPQGLLFDVAALASSPALVGQTTAPECTSPGFWPAARSLLSSALLSSALLSKALKIGGPAHAGLSPEEVEARQEAACGLIAARQSALVADLTTNFEAWDAAVQSAQSGFGTDGQLTLDAAFHLQEKVYRVVERDARAVLRAAYREMWMAGREAAGQFKPMSNDEEVQCVRMYRTQQNFFLNLLKDREMGTAKMDFARRITMYGNALRQAFFAGRVLADLSGDVFYRWTLGESEHCSDCHKLAGSGRWKNGTFSAREMARMGVWPGSGDTMCLTECGCGLERVKRPSGAPSGAALEGIELVGPSGSAFGGARVGREKFARAVKRNGWNHKAKRL